MNDIRSNLLQRGAYFFNALSSPPTIIASVPLRAPYIPPETGGVKKIDTLLSEFGRDIL